MSTIFLPLLDLCALFNTVSIILKLKEPILLDSEQTALARSFRNYPWKRNKLKENEALMQMFIQTTAPITGGACVISSTLNHNYSSVISRAWFMHHSCTDARSQDVRIQDVSGNACCGYDFIPSGLVMKDHFLCGGMIFTQIYSWVTEESHVLD